MDCSLPGTSIYGISQARKLEGVAIYSSRGSSRPRIKPRSPELQAISCIAGRFFTEDTHTHTKWQENVHLASQISRSSTGNSTSKRSSHPSQQWVNNFKVWGSLGDSVVKNPPAYQCKRCKRSGFDLWVRKILRRRKWQPTPIFLSRKFQEQRSLVGYSPWAHKESDMTEKLSTSVSTWTLKLIFSESFCWSQWVIRALLLEHLKRESAFLPARLNCSFQDLRFTGYFSRGLRKGSNCQHPLDHRKSKRVPEKHLFLLYWLCQSLWLCGSQ